MKKYLQLTILLGVFFVLVWWRDRHPSTDALTTVPTVTNQENSAPATTNPAPDVPASPTLPSTSTTSARYKNGTYTGAVTDAFYGNVQVRVTIKNGQLTSVVFLQHPNDNPTSQRINNQAMPLLSQQALDAQSANVDGVTGASATSGAFVQSLGNALQQAS